MNDTGLTTNFLIDSLYFKLKVWVWLDVIFNLNLSFIDSACWFPVVFAVATVTVPLTLLKDPEILFVINSILWSSSLLVPFKISLKYTFSESVLIPTVPIPVLYVANPI